MMWDSHPQPGEGALGPITAALGMEGLLGPEPGLHCLTQPSVDAVSSPLYRWENYIFWGVKGPGVACRPLRSACADLSLALLSWSP